MKNYFGKDMEPASVGASASYPRPLEKTDLGYEAKAAADAIRYDERHPLHDAFLKNTHPLHERAVREVQRLTEIVVGERGAPNKAVKVNAPAGVYDFSNSNKVTSRR